MRAIDYVTPLMAIGGAIGLAGFVAFVVFKAPDWIAFSGVGGMAAFWLTATGIIVVETVRLNKAGPFQGDRS